MFNVGDRVVYTGAFQILCPDLMHREGTVKAIIHTLSKSVADVTFDDYNYTSEFHPTHSIYEGNLELVNKTPDWEV